MSAFLQVLSGIEGLSGRQVCRALMAVSKATALCVCVSGVTKHMRKHLIVILHAAGRSIHSMLEIYCVP